MKTQLFAFLALGLSTSSSFAESTLITHVNLLDVENQKVVTEQDVFIENGVIQEFAPSSAKRWALNQNLKIISGANRYLTPGLIDAHIHADLYFWEKNADSWSMPLYIANGVTSVRDAAGSSLTLKIREDIESGKITGPRMVIASPFITSDKAAASENVILVSTPEEAKSTVKSFLEKGYDGVKTDSGLSLDVYHAAAETLQANGSYLFGHSLFSNAQGYWEILLDEVVKHYQSIEHLGFLGDFLQSETSPYFHRKDIKPGALDWEAPAYMDFNKVPALIALLKTTRPALSPTLITVDYQLRLDTDAGAFLAKGIEGFRTDPVSQYYPDYYFDVWANQYKTWGFGLTNPKRTEVANALANEKKLVKLLDDAGLDIIAGTDTPARPYIVAGFSLHDELAEYTSAGIGPWRVLRMATLNSARVMKREGKIGVIKKGAFADFILTMKNPIEDLSALRRPDSVMSHGKYFDRTALDQLLSDEKSSVRKMPASLAKGGLVHLDRPIFAHSKIPDGDQTFLKEKKK